MYYATFFDGKSSIGYQASVQLLPAGITIVYIGQNLVRYEILWDVSNIHQGDHSHVSKLTLKYGDAPYQYLQIDDPTFFDTLITTYPHKKFNTTDFEFLRSSGFKGLVLLFVFFFALIASIYWWVLPTVAEHFASVMPRSFEEQLGSDLYEQTTARYSIDQPRTKIINQYFRELHFESDYHINLTVVEEPDANAFALPGGHIIVFSGLIDALQTHEELAALVGHELSHITLRHSLRTLMRGLSGYLFISLLLGDASGISAVIVQNADNLKSLSYSRELEKEADANGFKLMEQEGINPVGMANLFRTLKGLRDDTEIPTFLNTHPLTDERIKMVEEKLQVGHHNYPPKPSLNSLWEELKNVSAD